MTHEHIIVDSDKHFVIDPVSRSISTESPKLVLVQGDHNSERYTFSVPANIEGHEMASCNRIEIHFTNLSRNKKLRSGSVYLVRDTSVQDDKLTFSWLIDGDATVHAGSLQFHVCFLCTGENNEIIYQWSTDTFSGISILARSSNVEAVAAEFPDVIGKLVDDYYAENPPAPGKSATVSFTRIDGGHKVTFEDINGIHEFEVADGAQGPEGPRGLSGGVASVNGVMPDENGNVIVSAAASMDELETIQLLMDMGVVKPVVDASGAMYINDAGNMYVF